MQRASLSFKSIKGLSSPDRRGVGLLEGHQELNAGDEFDDLSNKETDRLLAIMSRWCDGFLGPKKWFHNFDDTELMVFKLNEHRFYGYRYHPLPISNPAFLLCVLTIHVEKREWESDSAELDRVDQWRTNPRAKEAIAKVYPEEGGGKCSKLSQN
ncbi:MAG: hypothetical protein WA213_18905 [Terriglobales bacterium]